MLWNKKLPSYTNTHNLVMSSVTSLEFIMQSSGSKMTLTRIYLDPTHILRGAVPLRYASKGRNSWYLLMPITAQIFGEIHWVFVIFKFVPFRYESSFVFIYFCCFFQSAGKPWGTMMTLFWVLRWEEFVQASLQSLPPLKANVRLNFKVWSKNRWMSHRKSLIKQQSLFNHWSHTIIITLTQGLCTRGAHKHVFHNPICQLLWYSTNSHNATQVLADGNRVTADSLTYC